MIEGVRAVVTEVLWYSHKASLGPLSVAQQGSYTLGSRGVGVEEPSPPPLSTLARKRRPVSDNMELF